jgi:MFS family permease
MVERRQYNRYTVFVVSFICLGSASFGYSASVLSTGLSLPSFQKHFHLDTASNKAQIEGMMNSLYFTGGFFGAVLSGWMCKAFGRKASVIAGALVVLVSGGLLAASVNNAMFIAFRFFNGLG